MGMKADCANCRTHACYTKGVNCTGVDEADILAAYSEEERQIMKAAAYVESTFYSNITRLEETAEFAKAMGYQRLGLAFCIENQCRGALHRALLHEAGLRVLQRLLQELQLRQERASVSSRSSQS